MKFCRSLCVAIVLVAMGTVALAQNGKSICVAEITNVSKQNANLRLLEGSLISELRRRKLEAVLIDNGSADKRECAYTLTVQVKVVRQIEAGQQFPPGGKRDNGIVTPTPGVDETYYAEVSYRLEGQKGTLVDARATGTAVRESDDAIRATFMAIANRIKDEIKKAK